MGSAINLTGQRFGRLVALEPTKKRCGKKIVWKCICDCGAFTLVNVSDLKRGHTKSCGCLWEEIRNRPTHRMKNTPIYAIWRNIIQRCTNPKDPAYKNYGGRGIIVCERWQKFENFYADVGDKPEDMSFDRWPDNDGNYEPTNWRWASRHEQRINSRSISCGPFKQYWFRAWHKDSMAQYMSNNQHEFARKWKLIPSRISACLCGRQNIHKGWTFKRI